MTPLGTCDICARLIRLDQAGLLRRHDTVGVVIRARTGKRHRCCAGSGRPPREAISPIVSAGATPGGEVPDDQEDRQEGEDAVSAHQRLCKQHIWAAVAGLLRLDGYSEREIRREIAIMKKNPPAGRS